MRTGEKLTSFIRVYSSINVFTGMGKKKTDCVVGAANPAPKVDRGQKTKRKKNAPCRRNCVEYPSKRNVPPPHPSASGGWQGANKFLTSKKWSVGPGARK